MAKSKKIRIIPLGGLSEIGKNLTVVEYSDNILIIDCGIGFPSEDMLGVDLVMPDITYLVNNKDKIRGIVLTHGHEDHIGGLPFFLSQINVPVYGTRLTLGIVSEKLEEHKLDRIAKLICVKAGDRIDIGQFNVEFINVNHSIADAVALCIRTPGGTIVHSGDFKIDATPIDGEMTDLTRFGEIGREGVRLFMCESTNVERPGFTPSERTVGESLNGFFVKYPEKRIIITTFSSNVHRVQQIINSAEKHKRKVAITGRSMINIVKAANDLGYMKIPEGIIVDIAEINKYPPNKTVIISTGSQGEPMSALYRMTFNLHDKIGLGPDDLVIISASAIPGNEKSVGDIINELFKKGVKVVNEDIADVHVSGHACSGEIKILHALLKPQFFMPVHGEYRHLAAHKELAEYMGMKPSHIFVSDIGKVLEIDGNSAKFNGTVQSGRVLVDGYGIGDVGSVVLRDRKRLSEDGIVIVSASVSLYEGAVVSGPEIATRGFVYARESDELMNGAEHVCTSAITEYLDRGGMDMNQLRTRVKDELARYISQKTKRKPIVLPMITEAV